MTLEIDAASLRSHGQHCGRLAGRADTATSAAGSVSFHEESYGIIGGLLVYPAVAAFEAVALLAVGGVPVALRATQASVTAAANGFELLDGDVAAGVKKLTEALA